MYCPTRRLCLSYSELPPSDNHIRDIGYVYQGKKRCAVIRYTPEAEAYKIQATRYFGDTYFREIQAFARGHRPWMLYAIDVVLTVEPEDLLTKGWLKGEAKSPYKRSDTENRRKLLSDSVSAAIGIDDSLFIEGYSVRFIRSGTEPAVSILLEEVNPVHFGVPLSYLPPEAR